MRGLLYVMFAIGVIGLAYWAYNENYRTQSALAEVRALKRDIASLREALSVQRAEWAYLNRPERLRDLADLNFDDLGLMPMHPDQFGLIEQVAYPRPDPAPLGLLAPISGTVSLNALLGPEPLAEPAAESAAEPLTSSATSPEAAR
ncbi:hypothetical protein ABIE69_001212 [Rhodobacteraceae bacterium MBR-64]|jgi:hypothetical protein